MSKLKNWFGKNVSEPLELDVGKVMGNSMNAAANAPNPYANMAQNYSAAAIGQQMQLNPGKVWTTSDSMYRSGTEAFIRIERAANGRIVQVARNEGELFKSWLVHDGEEITDVIKQALADLKV